MSSTYRILCLSHDPATTTEAEYARPEPAEAARVCLDLHLGVWSAAFTGWMGGAPCVEFDFGPQQGSADTGGLGEAFEASGKGVDRCHRDAQSFSGLFGAQETVHVHSDHDKCGRLFIVIMNSEGVWGAAQIQLPAVSHHRSGAFSGTSVRVRPRGVQRRATSATGCPRAGLAVPLGWGPVQEGHHAGQADTAAGMAWRGVCSATSAGARGPECGLPQLLRLALWQAEGPQGRTAPIPVAEGFPAGGPVHEERPIQGHRVGPTAVAEDRGRAGSLVAFAAIRSVVGDGNQGFLGPVLRVVRRRDDRRTVTRGGLRGRDRSGVDALRDSVAREEDRQPAHPAAGGEEAPQGAEGAEPQGEGFSEPGQGQAQGRQGVRQGDRHTPRLGTQALHHDHPRQPSGVRGRPCGVWSGAHETSEVDSRRGLVAVRRHAGVQGSQVRQVLRQDRPMVPVVEAVLSVRDRRRQDAAERPVMDLPMRGGPRPGHQCSDQHSGRRTGGQAKRLWSAGKTGTCSGTARRSSNPPGAARAADGNLRPLGRNGCQSYPLVEVEVGCPPTTGTSRAARHRCYTHSVTEWVGVEWLRILADVHASSTEGIRALAAERRLAHWSRERLRRLRDELGIDAGAPAENGEPAHV